MKVPTISMAIIFVATVGIIVAVILVATLGPAAKIPPPSYLPAEDEEHEATWLSWPNDHGWDRDHVQRYEPIWIEMTEALAPGEKVNIIVWDKSQQRHVTAQLQNRNVSMSQIRFHKWKTSDVWIRDYGPLFTLERSITTNQTLVTDWAFNGWGRKVPWLEHRRDDKIPRRVRDALQEPRRVSIQNVVLEGGAVEVDGRGTFMAKRSCIVNDNRNPGLSEADIESYLTHHFDVRNFIWLDGVAGADITDDHIDGTARFAWGKYIVTHKREDFPPGQEKEYDILVNARDADGNKYEIVELPLTQKLVAYGYPGIYVNYYVSNRVVIVPAYDDPNDAIAAEILGNLYPNHTTVSIDVTEIYKDGGAAHCVTMQQPRVSF